MKQFNVCLPDATREKLHRLGLRQLRSDGETHLSRAALIRKVLDVGLEVLLSEGENGPRNDDGSEQQIAA